MGKARRSVRGSQSKGAEATTYTCDLCDSSFTKKSDHTKHMMEHSEQKPYACDQCEKSYRSKNALERHVVIHENSKMKKGRKSVPARLTGSRNRRGGGGGENSETMMETSTVLEEEEEKEVVGRNQGRSPKLQLNVDFLQNTFAPSVAKVRKSVGAACSSIMSVFDHGTEEEQHIDANRRKSGRRSSKEQKNFECDECHALLPSAVAFIEHMKTHRPKEVDESPRRYFTSRTENAVDQEEPVEVEDDEEEEEEEEEEFFECSVCGCGFAEESHLVDHVRQQHATTHPYVCQVCHHVFSQPQQLTAHLRSEHDKNVRVAFECNVCRKLFPSKEQLVCHMPEHSAPVAKKMVATSVPPLDARDCYTCHVCQISFALKSQLQRHVDEHHQHRRSQSVSSRSPVSSSGCESFLRSPSQSAASYACGICRSTFSRKLPMIKHVMTHMDEAYAEEAEEESASSSPATRQPLQQRTKVATVCQYCEMTFDDESAFRKHMDFHEKKEEEDESIRRSSSRLQQSEISIIEERYVPRRNNNSASLPSVPPSVRGPFVCSVCDKRFKSLISLNCHSVMHTGKRPIKKRGPNTKAAVISSLMERRLKSEGVDEEDDGEEEDGESVVLFVCQVCNRSFTEKTLLEKHVVKFHPNKKAFECDQCNRDFWSREALAKHQITHAGSSSRF